MEIIGQRLKRSLFCVIILVSTSTMIFTSSSIITIFYADINVKYFKDFNCIKDNPADGQTLLFEPASLLDEAHERSDACPRAHHEHGVGGLEGQAELRLPNKHGDRGLVAVVRYQFVPQPVGGHSLVNAASLGFVLHHHRADVDAVGVNLQKGELQTVCDEQQEE